MLGSIFAMCMVSMYLYLGVVQGIVHWGYRGKSLVRCDWIGSQRWMHVDELFDRFVSIDVIHDRWRVHADRVYMPIRSCTWSRRDGLNFQMGKAPLQGRPRQVLAVSLSSFSSLDYSSIIYHPCIRLPISLDNTQCANPYRSIVGAQTLRELCRTCNHCMQYLHRGLLSTSLPLEKGCYIHTNCTRSLLMSVNRMCRFFHHGFPVS